MIWGNGGYKLVTCKPTMQILRTLILSGTIFTSCMTTDDKADMSHHAKSISNVKDSIQNKIVVLRCQSEFIDPQKPYLELAIQLDNLVTAYLDSIDQSHANDLVLNLNKKYHLIFDSMIRQRSPSFFPTTSINSIDSVRFLPSGGESKMNTKAKILTTLSVLRTHNYVMDFFTATYSHDPCAGKKASR